MLLVTAIAVSIHGLSLLRNMAFVSLSCGALGALVCSSLKVRGTVLSWFRWTMLVSAILFAVSLSHLKHQMMEVRPSSNFSGSIGAPLESTVQEYGDALMKACLVASGVYIVVQGWRLLLFFSRTRVPNAPVVIVRFFTGALLCVGILGVGLSAHRAPVAVVPKSKPGKGSVIKRGSE
jgi:hypothetical protein